jgi:hypothetical protein
MILLLCGMTGCSQSAQPRWHVRASLTNRTDVTPGVIVRELQPADKSDYSFLVELPDSRTSTLLQLGIGLGRAEDSEHVGFDRIRALEIREGKIRPDFGSDHGCVWQNPTPEKAILVFLKENGPDRYYGTVTIETRVASSRR